MSITLTLNDRRRTLARVLPIVAIGAAMLLVAGFVYFSAIQNAEAAKPSDYGLTEGDTVSAAGSEDPDVYIVNEQGYKRLFLNPAIFGFYGHLGGFAKVKTISVATRDAFPTSGLFRNCETNDEKVYGVETTGEDTGMFHWVNVSGAQAVVQDPNFFSKVFCINTNEFNWYSKGTDYTSVSQVPSYSRVPGATPTPVAGNISVSLASDNPVAQTITKNAYGVTVMSLQFSGTGTVQELTFKRGGAGDTADYDNLYIYDGARRLTGGRTPSSADGTVTFISLKADVSGSKNLKLVADHSATAGNVDNWTLTSAKLASGTISGAPLQSNNFTISGSNSGTINVDKSGSVPNPKVGQKNAVLSEFKITANTEAAMVKRIQLINGGTVKNADITNLRLEVNSVKVADGAMTNDGYAVFDFGSGYQIVKGDNKIFKMIGDLAAKKDETVKFYQENATDINAVGDQFGFGMQATVDGNFDDSTNTHSLTLQGGVLTIAFNGPNASNVGTDTSDTILARYSFTAASDIEVKKLRLVLCEDDGGNGTYDAAADTTNGWADIDDVKVVDEDNGQVVVGPSDGSAFTASEATGCPDSVTGAAKTFTDTFDLRAGTTRNFKVTGDIKTANTRSGVALVSADIIRVVLDGYGEADLVTTTGDVAVMKYAGTNTAVDDSDIVPNTDLNGNNMTIQSSSLTLGLSSSPLSTTYVKGSKGIEAIGFDFTAARASALKVTDIKLSGYVRDTSGDTITLGVDATNSGVTVGGLISAVKLYDGTSGALISETPANSSLNTTVGTITFNNLAWNIAAGETRRLLVKTDLSSNATSGTSDQFSFDIAATTDVTAIDVSGKTVNAAAADPNPTNNTRVVTVANSGSILVTLAAGSPIIAPRYWGQTDTEISRFRVRTVDEAFLIEKLTFKGSSAANSRNNIDQLKVQYTNQTGSLLTAIGSLDNNGSVSFGFTGDNRPYVPKDSSVDIKVLANLKTKAGGATSEVNFSMDFTGAATTDFRAIGAGSGTLIQGNDTTDDDTDSVTANVAYIYRVYPEFIQDATLTASEPLGTKDVLKFSIKAWGLGDSKILFDDNETVGVASVDLKFEVVASGSVTTSNLTANLYDVDTAELLASRTITTPQDDALLAIRSSLSFDATLGGWEKDVEIQGGTTKRFRVEVAFGGFLDKSDYFQLILQDNEAGLFDYVDGGNALERNTVASVTGVFRLLPMNGPIFTKQ